VITISKLQEKIVSKKYYPETSIDNVSLSEIESDGRKLNKAIRELEEKCWINKVKTDKGFYCVVSENIYQDIPTKCPDLVDVFKNLYLFDASKNQIRRVSFPLIPIRFYYSNILSIEEMKYIYEHREEYQWYIINLKQFDYSLNYEKDGPFDLETAQKILHSTNNKVLTTKSAKTIMTDWNLAVSSEKLKSDFEEHIFNENLRIYYKSNFGWGLFKLGIITKEEKEFVSSRDFSSSITLSSGSTIVMGNDPEDWGNRLKEAQKNTVEYIGMLQKKLVLLGKINEGIERHGGWDKFLEDYKIALIAAMRENNEKEKIEDNSQTA